MAELNLRKATNIFETIFKILLLTYAAFSRNSFTIQSSIISFVMWPCFVLGAVLILNRVIHYKSYKMPYMWPLVAMLAATCVSVAFNYNYQLKDNVVYLVLLAFYFLLLYIRPNGVSAQSIKGELKLIGTIYTVWIEVCVVISLAMLFMGYSRIIKFPESELYVGIVFSRLFGVFTDPNLGAVSVCLATLLLGFVMYVCKKIWVRITLSVWVLLNIFYIALSDSRTGMVMLGVEAFVVVLAVLITKFKKTLPLKLCAVALSLVIAVFAAIVPNAVKRGYNQAVKLYVSSHTTDVEASQQQEDILTIDRDYDLSGDISNRRFSVWQSGIEIFASRPIVGTTFGGVTDYAKENLPQTYLVNNDYMQMNTFDNDIINVLVSNGLLGFIPFIIFAVGMFSFVLRRIIKTKVKDFPLVIMLLSATCGLAAASMFRSTIIYANTTVTNMFWIMLGALVAFIKISEFCDSREEIL